jgi:hypothetical protein
MQIDIADGEFVVAASLLGELLDVLPSDVQTLMQERAITSICERGVGIHQGEFRLTFFYRSRRVKLDVDTSGRIRHRSIIDFGARPLPNALRRPGD